MVYYNEIDQYCVRWLRNLIGAGLLPEGDVDERSIKEVTPDDIKHYTSCHFFAGLGGWPYAARLAGWPDDRSIWTGSCPCQPFSVAGRGAGVDDPRHLWPDFMRLIRTGRPPVVMGEQVAGAAGYGWIDGVSAGLEAEDYACRAVDIPACAINAPHIRSRMYWVADAATSGGRGRGIQRSGESGCADGIGPSGQLAGRGASSGALADAHYRPVAERTRLSRRWPTERPSERGGLAGHSAVANGMADTSNGQLPQSERGSSGRDGTRPAQPLSEGVADAGREGLSLSEQRGVAREAQCGVAARPAATERSSGHVAGFWDDWVLIGPDPKGKWRRVKPGLPLVAHGLRARVPRLRAFGNAIVPQLVVEVIRAYMETCQ